MPGIHHPTSPPDPAMLTPHPREQCVKDRCGFGPWRVEDQPAYRIGWNDGYHAAVATFKTMIDLIEVTE